MNPILLDLGIIKIYWYSILMAIAFIIGILIVYKYLKKQGIEEEIIINLIFYTIPISIIGARIYYVLFNLSYYSTNLGEIFKIWEGGAAIHGGIIAGAIFIYFYTKKNHISFFKLTDILVISLILGQAIGRWGNFFNGEAHGTVTTLEYFKNLHLPQFIINGMYINGEYYIPTFLYESIWDILGFLVLIISYKKLKKGQTSGLYLIWYGIGRFFIEQLRTDSLMLGNFRVAQIVSIIMILAGLIMFVLSRKEEKNE